MTPEQFANETEQKDELLFVLHHRDAPTVVFLECNSYAKREELAGFLRDNLTEYQFHDIDVTRFSVVSLLRVLTENLSPEIVHSAPVQHVVNVYGLENSLLITENGQIKPSLLTAQLNLERELLFRNVPYIIIIWADHFFFQTLQRESPDLWSWVVYRFRFEGLEVVNPENAPPLPPERLPQRGNIAERLQRIQELETTYNQLNLNTSDKKRLLKDKVTILKLLAEEYTEAFYYDKAQIAYENAIAIAERIQEDDFFRGMLHFQLAGVLLAKREFQEALIVYERSLSFIDSAPVYHQIGRIYQEQSQWAQALIHYQTALAKYTAASNVHELGGTHQQIGIVYQAQRQWTQALNNYQSALEWEDRAGNISGLGNIYHQIGMLYQDQKKWSLALENYQQALKWYAYTNDNFEMGGTYYQIGILFLLQNQPKSALEYLNKAFENCLHFGHPQIKLVKQALDNIQQAKSKSD